MTPSTDFRQDRSLPPHPTLEHLRKEAKALLKAHGHSDASACGPLRRLRRFARAGDDEILSAQLALNDAQFALAMGYGFASWKDLRDHVQRLRSGETPPSEPDEGRALTFGEREAWECVRSGVRDVEKLPEDIRARIVGITVAGSLVRGDFVTSRSDVDVYTILRDTAGSKAWGSEAHSCIRNCFDRHFSAYRGSSHNPFAWDDVRVSVESLPKRTEDFARHPFKTLSIYFFDLVKHHKTVWGEDFTHLMPEPLDPKLLVPARFDRMRVLADDYARESGDRIRIPMLACGSVIAAQVYFGEEPSIHKSEVPRRYRQFVPDFPGKAFGLDVWRHYLEAPFQRDPALLPHSYEEYVAFLKETQNLVAQNPL